MSDEKPDNTSGDLNLDLDFQLLPSWAKETPGKNPYADHTGSDRSSGRDRGGRRDSRSGGGGGPGGRGGDRRSGGGGGRGAQAPGGFRGPGGPRTGGGSNFGGDRRPSGGGGAGAGTDRRGPRRDGQGGPGAGAGSGPRDNYRGNRERGRPDDRDRGGTGRSDEPRRSFGRGPIPQEELPEAFDLKISFLPVPVCIQGVVNQLRSTRTASSLFAIAKLFLAKPERYLLRIKSLKPDRPLYQIGQDGAVSFDRSQLEFIAFEKAADDYFEIEAQELEEVKGNFNNVARCRIDGTLLGPTNHHSYQGKLRSLYEERYRSEMPFERFRQQIEVITDAEVVEAWKEEARKQTVYKTKDAENPKTFTDKAEARQYFILNYIGQVITKTHAVTVAGRDSRMIPDSDIQRAMRSAFEIEIRFPNRLAQALRSEFIKAGLHVFKHRKRMLYAWTFRPQLLKSNEENLAPGVRGILNAVKERPGLNRHELALAMIPELKAFEGKTEEKPGPEIEEKKNELAGYLHYLLSEGHIIEFQDGSLDFPLNPKLDQDRPKGGAKGQNRGRKDQVKKPGTQEKAVSEKPETKQTSVPSEASTVKPVTADETAETAPSPVKPAAAAETQAEPAPVATESPIAAEEVSPEIAESVTEKPAEQKSEAAPEKAAAEPVSEQSDDGAADEESASEKGETAVIH